MILHFDVTNVILHFDGPQCEVCHCVCVCVRVCERERERERDGCVYACSFLCNAVAVEYCNNKWMRNEVSSFARLLM